MSINAPWQETRLETNLIRIESFAAERGLDLRNYESLGKQLLTIDISTSDPIDPTRANEYLEQHALEADRGITNNCFFVACRAVRRIGATGLISGIGTSEMIGWENHYINWDQLQDGSVAAVDLTASRNIDYGTGLIDVLALRAPDKDTLLESVTDLYEGSWAYYSEKSTQQKLQRQLAV